MNEPIQKTLPVEIREPGKDAVPCVPDQSPTCLDFIASDATPDRYGEIIQASGWQLENYQRNPVFQNSHQYGDILFTLGKALITEVRTLPRSTPDAPPSTCLFQRIQFACDINPMAKIAYGLYKGKFLNAVSVGFVPIRWETPGSAGVPAGNSTYTRKFLEQELLEVSAVAIPANPNALALGLKSGAIEKSDVQDLGELLRLTLDSETETKKSKIENNLSFLRAIHAVLRS